MPVLSIDWSPFVLAVAAAVATCLALVLVLGRRDRSRPRCAACGADARLCAWSSPCRCGCGADLSTARAIHWGVRRPAPLVWAVVATAVGTGAVLVVAARVRATTVGWHGALPDAALAALIRTGASSESLTAALQARAEQRLSPEQATRFVEALAGARIDLATEVKWQRIMCLFAEVAPPQGAAGALFAGAIGRRLIAEFTDKPGEVRIAVPNLPSDSVLLVRLREVRRNGVAEAVRVSPTEAGRAWTRARSLRAVAASGEAFAPTDTLEMHVDLAILPVGDELWVTLGDRSLDEPELAELGVAVASASVVVPIAAPRTTGRATTAVSIPELLDPFVEVGARAPRSVQAAAVHLVAAMAAGALAGAWAFLVGVLALRVACGRPRLAPPSCVACGSQLRGRDAPTPDRCPECGTALLEPRRVRWHGDGRSAPRACAAVVVALVGAAAVPWGASLAARDLVPLCERWVVTPGADARAVVAVAVDGASRREWIQAQEMLSTGMRSSEELDEVVRGLVEWFDRTGGRFAAPAPWSIERAARLRLARVLLVAASVGGTGRSEAVRAAAGLVSAGGDPPEIDLPRCVPLGEEVRPIATSTLQPALLVRSGPEPSASWTSPGSARLGAFDAEGSREMAIEWALGATATPGPGDALASGVLRRQVRVLARPAEPASVSDPALDPFQPSRPISLFVRELGAVDLIRLSSPGAGLGLDVEGHWLISFGDAVNVAELVHLRDGVEWAGLAATPSPLPDTATLTFVPIGERTRTRPSQPWRWGGRTTIRLRLREDTPSAGFEGVGAEYVRE